MCWLFWQICEPTNILLFSTSLKIYLLCSARHNSHLNKSNINWKDLFLNQINSFLYFVPQQFYCSPLLKKDIRRRCQNCLNNKLALLTFEGYINRFLIEYLCFRYLIFRSAAKCLNKNRLTTPPMYPPWPWLSFSASDTICLEYKIHLSC